MGARKRIVADKRKEANKSKFFAKLNNCPTSPMKMRLVADLVRGEDLNKALDILTFTVKKPQAVCINWCVPPPTTSNKNRV